MNSSSNTSEIGARESLVDIFTVFVVTSAAVILEKTLQHLGWIALPESASGVSAVIAGGITAVALIFLRKQKLSDIGFKRPERWGIVPLWVIGIFLVFIASWFSIPALLKLFIEIPDADLSRYDSLYQNLSTALTMVLILPLTASIPEEIIYRGFLLDRLIRIFGSKRTGLISAVAIQSMIFGAIHYKWGAGGALNAAAMGAIWGTAFLLVKRNLWIVIMAHSLGHIVMVTTLYFFKASELSL